MINADPLPALNVELAFEAWRERRWTTEWGGVWAPPRLSLEREAFAAGYEAGLRALAEAGLVRNRSLDTCDGCSHDLRWHTQGGMCQGTGRGIECHCSRIPPLAEAGLISNRPVE
jgi:hypothetical protein